MTCEMMYTIYLGAAAKTMVEISALAKAWKIVGEMIVTTKNSNQGLQGGSLRDLVSFR